MSVTFEVMTRSSIADRVTFEGVRKWLTSDKAEFKGYSEELLAMVKKSTMPVVSTSNLKIEINPNCVRFVRLHFYDSFDCELPLNCAKPYKYKKIEGHILSGDVYMCYSSDVTEESYVVHKIQPFLPTTTLGKEFPRAVVRSFDSEGVFDKFLLVKKGRHTMIIPKICDAVLTGLDPSSDINDKLVVNKEEVCIRKPSEDFHRNCAGIPVTDTSIYNIMSFLNPVLRMSSQTRVVFNDEVHDTFRDDGYLSDPTLFNCEASISSTFVGKEDDGYIYYKACKDHSNRLVMLRAVGDEFRSFSHSSVCLNIHATSSNPIYYLVQKLVQSLETLFIKIVEPVLSTIISTLWDLVRDALTYVLALPFIIEALLTYFLVYIRFRDHFLCAILTVVSIIILSRIYNVTYYEAEGERVVSYNL